MGGAIRSGILSVATGAAPSPFRRQGSLNMAATLPSRCEEILRREAATMVADVLPRRGSNGSGSVVSWKAGVAEREADALAGSDSSEIVSPGSRGSQQENRS